MREGVVLNGLSLYNSLTHCREMGLRALRDISLKQARE